MRDVHKPGRPSKPVRVADVRTLECPEASLPGFPPGNHDLVNLECRDVLVTVCRHCKVPWGDLDLAARKPAEPAPKATRCHCGVTLMSERRWAEAATEVRQQWRTEGFAPRASGMCDRCARRMGRAS